MNYLTVANDVRTAAAGLSVEVERIVEETGFERIHIIGHSLGGLIARYYITRLAGDARVHTLITLGTPGQGSNLATVGRFASNSPAVRVLLPIRVNDFQQLLNATITDVLVKHAQWKCPSIITYSGFETLPIAPGLGLVVGRESATFGANITMGFEKTHVSISKPRGVTDPVYVWVNQILQDCAAERGVCEPATSSQFSATQCSALVVPEYYDPLIRLKETQPK